MQNINTKYLNYKSGVFGLTFFTIAAIVILGFPSVTSLGAYNGLKISSNVIIPALFPFTVVSIFLVKSGGLFIISKTINPVTLKLFGLGGTQFAVIIISLLGGYPVGAKTINELKSTNQIDEYTAKRLLKHCINPSPAFFINIVGINVLGSKTAGVILLLANGFACIILNIITFKVKPAKQNLSQYKKAPLSAAFVESVTEGAKIIIGISAFVVLFSAVAAVAKNVITSKDFYYAICPFLEISFGINEVKNIGISPSLYAFILSFGGISTICQIKQAADGIKAGFIYIIWWRIVHGLTATGIAYILFKLFPITLQTINNGVMVSMTELPLFLPSAALIIFATVFLLFINGENKKVEE